MQNPKGFDFTQIQWFPIMGPMAIKGGKHHFVGGPSLETEYEITIPDSILKIEGLISSLLSRDICILMQSAPAWKPLIPRPKVKNNK